MPHYHFHIATNDGSLNFPDPDGITLDGIGAARAIVTELLIEAARERPKPGTTRIITVTVEDEYGGIAYRDSVTVRGRLAPSSEDQAVWRAMAAMNRAANPAAQVRGFSPTQS